MVLPASRRVERNFEFRISDFELKITKYKRKTNLAFRNPHSQIRNPQYLAPLLRSNQLHHIEVFKSNQASWPENHH
jgi:hypothetical protein